jgi:hypothetical protein
MLSLTDRQLETLMQVAAGMWPQRRDQFLRSVAGRLRDIACPTDKQLQDAIDFVLDCYGVSTPHPARAS